MSVLKVIAQVNTYARAADQLLQSIALVQCSGSHV